MSQYSEQFHCPLSVAMAEIDRLPPGLMDTVITLRAYAQAWRGYEVARRRDAAAFEDWQAREPLATQVIEFVAEDLESAAESIDG